MAAESERPAPARGPVRGPQSFIGGLLLLALALLALWATSSLSQGTLRAMGPAMLPRWLAVGIGACGLALAVAGVLRVGEALEVWSLRGPGLVLVGIFAFAVTIRPFDLGIGTTPGLGLAVAGPVAIIVSGYATPEARLRELVILAFALTAGCMVLFGDLLNLPIPLYPQAVADLLPSGWSNDARLRAIAALLGLAALLLWFATRRSGGAEQAIDVALPSQRD